MAENVADCGDLTPRNFRVERLEITRDSSAGFGNDLDTALYGVAQQFVFGETSCRLASGVAFDPADGIAHVGKRHSRGADRHQNTRMASRSISRRMTRVQTASRKDVGPGSQDASQVPAQIHQIEKRKFHPAAEINKDVHITAGATVSTGRRAEQVEMLHAERPDSVRMLRDCIDCMSLIHAGKL
jgi:hypothetical protein